MKSHITLSQAIEGYLLDARTSALPAHYHRLCIFRRFLADLRSRQVPYQVLLDGHLRQSS